MDPNKVTRLDANSQLVSESCFFELVRVEPCKSTFCQAIDTINSNFAHVSDIIHQPVLPNDLSAKKKEISVKMVETALGF